MSENDTEKKNEFFKLSHLTILIVYTIFSVVLIAETLLFSWETWALPLVIVGVIAAWGIHIFQRVPERYRLWTYAVFMMVTFFFYGIHETSMYDLAPVIGIVIVLYSMTGVLGLVNLCLFSYYLTMFYDFMIQVEKGTEYDVLGITRLLLHLVLVYIFARLAKIIIKTRIQAYQKSEKRIGELTELNRRTDDFLTNISHEIRTPINAVIGLTTVLMKREKDAQIKREMSQIKGAGHRVAEQISDILDYTEIDMKKLSVSHEAYMISSVVNDLVTEYRLVTHTDCELIFDIEAKLPSVLVGDAEKIRKILWHLISNGIKFTKKGCVYVHIYGIEKPYGVNLCIEVSDTGTGIAAGEMDKIYEKFYQSNSGRARTAGGLGLGMPIVYGFVKEMGGFITLDSQVEVGTTVHVSIPQEVSDASPCMSIEHVENLCLAGFLRFERFDVPQTREYYREMITHTVKDFKTPLHWVSELSELWKLQKIYKITHLFVGADEYLMAADYLDTLASEIKVIVVAEKEFSTQKGSKAYILRKPFYGFSVAGLLNAGSDDLDKEERQMRCLNIRALVVDDEPMNLLVAEGIFKDYGMQVKTASGGLEAIEICKNEDFDLIFMDHMMPEIDGVETMKQIRLLKRESKKEYHVVALTANAVSSAKDMFLSEGFDAFIFKPIEISELERTLRKLLPKSAIVYERPGVQKTTDTAENAEDEKKETEAGEDLFTALSKTDLDTEAGISYCRNDKPFYKSLLLKFAADAEGHIIEMRKFYEVKDWENYRIKIHALKSTSKMIGANEISEISTALEQAAKEEAVSEILLLHDILLQKYEALALTLAGILKEGRDVVEQEIVEVEGSEVLAGLSELSDALETFEAERAEEILEKISCFRFQNELLGETLYEVRKQMEEFDLEAAQAEVKKVITFFRKQGRDKA